MESLKMMKTWEVEQVNPVVRLALPQDLATVAARGQISVLQIITKGASG